MSDFILSWLNQTSLLPHGYCIKWSPSLMSVYVISDSLIALSYYAIPIALGYFAHQRKDLIDYQKTLWLFAAFIIACGTTHLISIFIFWQPLYWLDAGLKALTALISVITVIHLFPQIPILLRTPNPEHLLKLNQSLEQEIALRKQTEAALRHEKQLSDDIVNSLPGVFYILNDQGHLIHWNSNLQTIVGYPIEEMQGQHALNFIANSDHALVSEKIRECFEKGSTVVEAQLQRKDGDPISYYFSAKRVDLESQTILIGLGSDFSEHKHMEEVQRLSELKFRTLFNSSRDAIMLLSLEGIFTDCNPAAVAMFGFQNEQEFLGTTPACISPEFQPDGQRSIEKQEILIAQIMKEGSLFFEWLHHRVDGTEFIAEVSVMRVKLYEKIMLQAVVRDITERKNAEALLKKAKETAEATARMKSNFLANMSHEIRTPMNAVLGFAQLALNLDITPQMRGYLDKITVASQSLLQIINDILDVSKSEAGRMTLENSSFNLKHVLNALDSLFSMRAQQKGLGFDILLDPDVPNGLVGDKFRLQQVLSNLLSNAIKFTSRGNVMLKVRKKHQDTAQVKLVFEVEDTGIGMTETERSQLFQPFNQADNSITRRFGGTGLGLVISRNLLRLMGGEFSVKCTPGTGSIFSFELIFDLSTDPIQEAEGEADSLSGMLDRPSYRGNKLAGARILVAEDSPTNQQVVMEFLQLSGASVVCAEDGLEALKKLENGEFEAVLMDIHMPNMDGITATQQIRQLARYEKLPIIALTASVMAEERAKCLSCGMNDFVAKPIMPEQLIATLLRWLKLKPMEDAQTLEKPVHKTMTSFLPNLQGFDFRAPLEMLGGHQDKLIEILCRFRDDLVHINAEIDIQLEIGDMAKIKANLHTLKGIAGNVGAKALRNVTIQLESELGLDPFNRQTLELFRKTVNEILFSLASLHKPEKSADITQAFDTFDEAIDKLHLLLSKNVFIDSAILDNISMLMPPDDMPLFVKLCEQINGIHYIDARVTLEHLRTTHAK